MVDALLASPKKQARNQTNNDNNPPNDFERFIAQTDLKPTFLNQDTNMVELNQWCTQLSNYINAGYRGNPPNRGVFMHLPPMMHPSWVQALEAKNPNEHSVDDLIEFLKVEGKLRMPVHQRRLQLLKVKRGSTRHSDFIFQIGKLMSVAEFTGMSEDQMLIHLFVESADPVMSKIGLEILAGDNPTIAELRTKVTETENALWYKSPSAMGKVAREPREPTERYCE